MRSALRHCMDRFHTIRKPDPVELVQIAVPIIIEVVAISLFIAGVAAWVIIAATPVVPA